MIMMMMMMMMMMMSIVHNTHVDIVARGLMKACLSACPELADSPMRRALRTPRSRSTELGLQAYSPELDDEEIVLCYWRRTAGSNRRSAKAARGCVGRP